MNEINQAKSILIIQPETPDGDSLASALALEQIFYNLDKDTHLFCPVDIPRHLRYISGWDRVEDNLDSEFDVTIIVDTSSKTLLEKVFEHQDFAKIAKKPIVIIDHHDLESDLSKDYINLSDKSAASTSEVIYDLALKNDWPIDKQTAKLIVISIMYDTLGLSTEQTSAKTIRIVADMVEKGVQLNQLDFERRQMMIRPQKITEYKGELLKRIEYYNDGELAVVIIPWEEIKEYSHLYNPSVLVMEDMRLTEGVRVAVALKQYPDGKVTGKIRANDDSPYGAFIANKFGGGGHTYAAGFKVNDIDTDTIKQDLIKYYEEAKHEVV